MWLLALLAVAVAFCAVVFVVGWFVALGRAVWVAVKGEPTARDHRSIEQDSAGLY
jgi:hypothetical protein